MCACSPSLNWRAIELGRLSTLLPCKPDSGDRQVQLADFTVGMAMMGCAVEDSLFTVSRIQAADAQQAAAILGALRSSGLGNVHARNVHPMPNTGDAETSLDLQVEGQRDNGAPLQARFKWLLAGAEVYQLAVYADHLTVEQTDSLINEAHIR